MMLLRGLPFASAAAWLQLSSAAASSPTLSPKQATKSSISSVVYKTTSGNLTFAATAVQENGDLFFHVEAPAKHQYIAIGAGGGMVGSMMLIAYPSKNGKGVTLSPRTVHTHVEPSYTDRLQCEVVTEDVTNGIIKYADTRLIVLNGHCKGVNNLQLNKLDNGGRRGDNLNFSNTEQPFIFALGPTDRVLRSNAKDAGIRRHAMYGRFKMDMTKAVVEKTDDVDMKVLGMIGTWETRNSQVGGNPTRDTDYKAPIHSVAMCGTFVILFPIGVVFLRLLEKVKWHAWMQGAGTLLVICGLGIGLNMGKMYNKSKNVNSAHQIIGLVVVASTVVQFSLGLIHHLIWKKTKRSTIMGRVHLYAGPLVLLIGAANGFLGFRFSSSNHNLMYGIVCIVVLIGLAVALVFARRRKAKKTKSIGFSDQTSDIYLNQRRERHVVDRSGFVDQAGGDFPLTDIPKQSPPDYDERPAQPRSLV